MLSLFSIVGLALYAQTITSLPTSPLSNDAGLSAHRGLDPNQFSTIDSDAGALFPSLDASSSDDAEALLSPQLALSVGSSASAPPLASQDLLDRGCDKAPKAKGKRNTGGADTSFCPAYLTNPVTPGAVQGAPQKKPEGQQQQNFAPQEPKIATPRKPESRGDVRLTPSDEPVRNPFGEKDKDPQCPRRYKYTVCGISDLRYLNLVASLTIYDADLLINSGFGFGMVIRPDLVLTTESGLSKAWKGHAGIAGWTDALEECGPDPRKIYCCSIYLPESRQAYNCETVERARRSEQCWKVAMGLPSQTVLKCIENL